MALELDRKSKRDLMLIAQLSLAGHAEANNIRREILSGPALETPYNDLSRRVPSRANGARKNLDRPPVWHADRGWWSWSDYSVCRREVRPASPDAVPVTGSCHVYHWTSRPPSEAT